MFHGFNLRAAAPPRRAPGSMAKALRHQRRGVPGVELVFHEAGKLMDVDGQNEEFPGSHGRGVLARGYHGNWTKHLMGFLWGSS